MMTDFELSLGIFGWELPPQWLKDDLTQTCPDEQTLLEILRDIRRDYGKPTS